MDMASFQILCREREPTMRVADCGSCCESWWRTRQTWGSSRAPRSSGFLEWSRAFSLRDWRGVSSANSAPLHWNPLWSLCPSSLRLWPSDWCPNRSVRVCCMALTVDLVLLGVARRQHRRFIHRLDGRSDDCHPHGSVLSCDLRPRRRMWSHAAGPRSGAYRGWLWNRRAPSNVSNPYPRPSPLVPKALRPS